MATHTEPPSKEICTFLKSPAKMPASAIDDNLQNVDELLADEMSRLSIQERYHMDNDVKGKNLLSAIEPAELVSMGLKAMDTELRTMKKRTFYDKALSLNSRMVISPQFRLGFARADAFDPVAAASRMENHLQHLYENFGDEGLTRPILLSDLDKVERDLLKGGSFQLLPTRDKAGRCIMARLGNFGKKNKHSLKHKLRVTLYLTQVVSEDEETAKQGMVLLHWPLQTQEYTHSHIGPIRKVAMCSPIRISAFHFCLNEDQRPAAVAMRAILTLCPEYRSRCRIHTGSVTECQYALMSYGIPSDYIPITSTGNIKNQNHHKWIAYREAKEQTLRKGVSFDGIYFPSVKDVLAGKGPHVLSHPGNCEFRRIIQSRFEEHRDSTVTERKTAITWEVVLEVQRRGGRFLVKDQGWWAVADQDTAREKVSVAFRDMRKYSAKALGKKRQDDTSSTASDTNKMQKTF